MGLKMIQLSNITCFLFGMWYIGLYPSCSVMSFITWEGLNENSKLQINVHIPDSHE